MLGDRRHRDGEDLWALVDRRVDAHPIRERSHERPGVRCLFGVRPSSQRRGFEQHAALNRHHLPVLGRHRRRREECVPQCGDRAFLGGTGGDGVDESLIEPAAVLQHDVVLAREVPEERSCRHAGSLRDLVDGDRVEAAFGEEAHRGA